jgi:hypothetical protein
MINDKPYNYLVLNSSKIYVNAAARITSLGLDKKKNVIKGPESATGYPLLLCVLILNIYSGQ